MKKRTWMIGVVGVAAIAAVSVPTVHAMADEPRSAGHWCDTDELRPLLELTAGDGTGKLYTLSETEAEKAIDKHKMTLSDEPVAYLPCQEFADSIAFSRLKKTNDSDTWIVTRSDSNEAEQLEDKGWINEGISGFLYRDSTDKVLLNRYTNGQEWIIAPETDADTLAADGYELDGPLGYAYPEAP